MYGTIKYINRDGTFSPKVYTYNIEDDDLKVGEYVILTQKDSYMLVLFIGYTESTTYDPKETIIKGTGLYTEDINKAPDTSATDKQLSYLAYLCKNQGNDYNNSGTDNRIAADNVIFYEDSLISLLKEADLDKRIASKMVKSPMYLITALEGLSKNAKLTPELKAQMIKHYK